MELKKVGLVIPCYNEAEDISKSVETIKEYLKDKKDHVFFIVPVNDGSKDNTEEVIKSIDGVYPVSYTPNGGKGHAVREGMRYCLNELKCDYVIFMDADLSTDLVAIDDSLKLLDCGAKFAIGSRYNKDSNIKVKQPFKRRLISKCSRIIISMMFHFKIKDTQCGFKAMDKEICNLLIEKTLMDGFSFDVEYIYIAKLNKYPYETFPVIWSDDTGSTVSALSTSIRFFKDLFKIKKNKKKYLPNEKA